MKGTAIFLSRRELRALAEFTDERGLALRLDPGSWEVEVARPGEPFTHRLELGRVTEQ